MKTVKPTPVASSAERGGDDLVDIGSLGDLGDIASHLESLSFQPLGESLECILSRSGVNFRAQVEVGPTTPPLVPQTSKKLEPDAVPQNSKKLESGAVPRTSKKLEPGAGLELQPKSQLGPESGDLLIGTTAFAAKSRGMDLRTLLFQKGAAVIGGAIVSNLSLVMGMRKGEDVLFTDLPVSPVQVPEGNRARLFVDSTDVEGEKATPLPALVLPESLEPSPHPAHLDLFMSTAVSVPALHGRSLAGAGFSQSNVMAETLHGYTLTGDIDDFWGIPGLRAKLYKYKGSVGDVSDAFNNKASVKEKIKLDVKSASFKGTPLGVLFPFMDNEDIRNLPISNLEFTYSDNEPDSTALFKPGLYLELDVLFEKRLSWVGDSLRNLFGTIKRPSGIHLSAWLSDERSWSEPPKFDEFVLDGYFKDLSLNAWDILQFRNLGIEIMARKEDGYDTESGTGSSWKFGFGFIGQVMITNVPEAKLPVSCSYKIAKHPATSISDGLGDKASGREWTIVILANNWQNVFGFEHITMEEALLSASFAEGSFSSSIRLDIAGQLRIGAGGTTIQVRGQFAKGWKQNLTWSWVMNSIYGVPLVVKHHYLKATIGNLRLEDIEDMYGHIVGHERSADSKLDLNSIGQEITFRNLSISIASTKYTDSSWDYKALELFGEVTVGGVSTYAASITFNTDGISVRGRVDNMPIPDTSFVLEKAGLDVFLALRRSRRGGSVSEGRKSSCGVFGVVRHENVTFRAGFYTSNKRKGGKRDWLVFGSTTAVKLRELWPSIPEDSFLNLQLGNVAIIASSEDKAVRTNPLRSQDAVTGKEVAKIEIGSSGIGMSVEEEIAAFGYPIIAGVQICATISVFPQLEGLNNNKKIPGLALRLGIGFNGSITAALAVPPSFYVELSDSIYLSNFAIIIAISSTLPELQLKATLTVKLQDSDPFVVHGVLVGTVYGARGELKMDDNMKWINPFNLSKELVVSKLGVGLGFVYVPPAPNYFALSAQVNIGDVIGKLSLGVAAEKGSAVLLVELNTLDITNVVQMAGTLSGVKKLREQEFEKKVFIIFSDLKLYVSSGATFLDVLYKRGIEIRGRMNFFGIKGDFDGSFTEDGILMNGGLDAFNFGGLEVTSLKEYKGQKRATLDIEMTKSGQKVLIDGIVRYLGSELQVYINANLQKGLFDADIKVFFTEGIFFHLQASAEFQVDPSKGLGDSAVNFYCELGLDVFKAIGDGIIACITSLNALATDEIDQAVDSIDKDIKKLEQQLRRQKQELDRLLYESAKEEQKLHHEIDKENQTLRQLYDEIQKLQTAYDEALARGSAKQDEITRQEQALESAKARLNEKKREMRAQYDAEIEKQREDQKKWENKKHELQRRKEENWGDQIRSGEEAERQWNISERIISQLRNRLAEIHREEVDTNFFLRPELWFEEGWVSTELGAQISAQAITNETIKALRFIISTDEFRSVDTAIINAGKEIDKFGQALGALVTEGPVAYIQRMSRDENREYEQQQELLDSLIADSKKLVEEIAKAKSALDNGKERLSPEQEQARKKIASLEQRLKEEPYKHDYNVKRIEFEGIRAQAEGLQKTLLEIKHGIKLEDAFLRQIVEMVASGLPHIKQLTVSAGSQALVKNEPLKFGIKVSWAGNDYQLHVEWTLNVAASSFYNDVAKAIANLVTGR